MTYPIGPMCAVNRITSEPPSHRDCARYAAQACPFLRTPTMQRRERNLPTDKINPPGTMIMRNPGVTALWTTQEWELLKQPGGVLFALGDPAEVEWFTRGRAATRAEVEASIDSGMPLLVADAQQNGPDAVAAVLRDRASMAHLLPHEPVPAGADA